MANIQNPTTAQLLDWLEGRLSPTELPLLTAALQTNPTLQEQVVWLRDFLQISLTTTLANPPADTRQANRAIFMAYAQAKRPPNIWQTLIATLTADNWQRLSLSGVRDVSWHTTPRQLITQLLWLMWLSTFTFRLPANRLIWTVNSSLWMKASLMTL